MKTDHLFYRLFKELPSTFFELIDYPPSQANTYKFESVELKQTAFRIDGLFLPKDNSSNPIYFIEVQFQKDPEIYARLFSEIFLYLRLNGVSLAWRAVIIFKSRQIEPSLKEREPYQPLLDSNLVQRLYLDQLEITPDTSIRLKIVKLVVVTRKQIAEQVIQLVSQIKQELNDEKLKQQAIDLIETIVLYKLPQISKQELATMFGTEDLRKTRFAQEMREEGRTEGKLETIPRLLKRSLSVEEIAEILELDIEQVRQIAQNHS